MSLFMISVHFWGTGTLGGSHFDNGLELHGNHRSVMRAANVSQCQRTATDAEQHNGHTWGGPGQCKEFLRNALHGSRGNLARPFAYFIRVVRGWRWFELNYCRKNVKLKNTNCIGWLRLYLQEIIANIIEKGAQFSEMQYLNALQMSCQTKGITDSNTLATYQQKLSDILGTKPSLGVTV